MNVLQGEQNLGRAKFCRRQQKASLRRSIVIVSNILDYYLVKGFLSNKERLALEQELRLERYARYSDRIKCILLLDLGKSIDSICEYLFLSRGSVNNYHSRYIDGGLEELTADDYQGTECRLKEAELDELSLHLEENLYQTVAAIRDYIELNYKVQYSLGGLRHLLRLLEFVYKKPKAVPGKANKQAQEEFLHELERKLHKPHANTAIYYADGVHPPTQYSL